MVETAGRGRHGLEPLGADLLTTDLAGAVGAVVEPGQRLLHQTEVDLQRVGQGPVLADLFDFSDTLAASTRPHRPKRFHP